VIAGHIAAVKARLTDGTALAGKLYDSARLDSNGVLIRDTYAILYGGTPDVLDDGRQSSPQAAMSDAEFVYTFRSVSPTVDGCRAVQQIALTRLTGFVAALSGRTCSPIVLTSSGDPRPDMSVNPPIFYADDEYTLRSSRA
jgi:hypothetical protein